MRLCLVWIIYREKGFHLTKAGILLDLKCLLIDYTSTIKCLHAELLSVIQVTLIRTQRILTSDTVPPGEANPSVPPQTEWVHYETWVQVSGHRREQAGSAALPWVQLRAEVQHMLLKRSHRTLQWWNLICSSSRYFWNILKTRFFISNACSTQKEPYLLQHENLEWNYYSSNFSCPSTHPKIKELNRERDISLFLPTLITYRRILKGR